MADNVRPDAVLSAHPLLSAEIDRLRTRLAEVESRCQTVLADPYPYSARGAAKWILSAAQEGGDRG